MSTDYPGFSIDAEAHGLNEANPLDQLVTISKFKLPV